MAVVNVRGSNGSGKSTLAHKLIEKHRHRCELVALAAYRTKAGKTREVTGYNLWEAGIIVVGSYRTQCGGCDAIPTQDLVCEAVRAAADLTPNVLFEGLLVSGIYARYHALAQELEERRGKKRRRFVFAYCTTPLEECLRRVYQRNGGKPIKEELVGNKLRSVENTRLKALEDGHEVVQLPWRRAPLAQLTKLLED